LDFGDGDVGEVGVERGEDFADVYGGVVVRSRWVYLVLFSIMISWNLFICILFLVVSGLESMCMWLM